MSQRVVASLALALGLASAPPAASGEVAAGAWFTHPFGELRSYHGDWLAVCEQSGLGACRLVHYVYAPGETDRFFGEARISIESDPEGAGVARLEMFRRGAPDEPLGPVRVTIGATGWTLRPGREIRGARTQSGGRISESYEIDDPAILGELSAAMREGRRMRLRYLGRQGPDSLSISLRGFNAGMDAIDRHEAAR